VLRAGIGGGHWVVIGIFLVMVVVIFAGLLHHAGAMVFGEPRGAGRKAEAWSPLAAMLLLAAIMVLLGLTIPVNFDVLLRRATEIVVG
jgi:NADH:ubiquinone oxidoreductase subunit 2 (subunit N)